MLKNIRSHLTKQVSKKYLRSLGEKLFKCATRRVCPAVHSTTYCYRRDNTLRKIANAILCARLSNKERRVDALALRADERRDKLR